MRFWHYRIDGLTPGQMVNLRHDPSRNMHFVYSYNGEDWFRFPTAGVSDSATAIGGWDVAPANLPEGGGRNLS